MKISEYQKKALETDITQKPMIALLGLAGEIGSLYSVYKKKLRDKPNAEQFKSELSEELGDVLWYLCALASAHDIELEDVAQSNIKKTIAFFGEPDAPYYDAEFPENERFPDSMTVRFSLESSGRSQMTIDGKFLGDSLSDNSVVEDKYRFHDAFHLAFIAHLHWSPVMRKLLGKKRKSNSVVDENEDGARAEIVEEAVIAIIFTHAETESFFPTIEAIPLSLINLLMKMTSKFEVSQCTSAAWKKAVFDGCQIFQSLSKNDGGCVQIDYLGSTIINGGES